MLDDSKRMHSPGEQCVTCSHAYWEHIRGQACAHLMLGVIWHTFCDCRAFTTTEVNGEK